MTLLIKNCGLRDDDAIRAAIESGADLIGFIHYAKSPRFITPEAAATLWQPYAATIRTVGVWVNPDDTELNALPAHYPSIIQLHGDESPERVVAIRAQINRPVIKAVGIASSDDIQAARRYESVADYLLLDTKHDDYGGTGQSFDWGLLRTHPFTVPWFLSGGLNADNIEPALRQMHPAGIDVSSGIESAPGVKNTAKMIVFNEKVRRYANS